MAGEGLDLAQFAILYRECLFSPDTAERQTVTGKINRGTEIAAALGAQAFLLRPGSRSPAGSWTPHRNNHLPECRDLRVEWSVYPFYAHAALEMAEHPRYAIEEVRLC